MPAIRSTSDHDDEQQSRTRGHGAGEIDEEPSRSHAFDEHEEQACDEEGEESKRRDERHPAKILARLGPRRVAFLERPVSELRGHEEPGGGERCCTVERRVVDGELRRVHAPEHDECGGKERRPPEYERAHEEEHGERRDPETDVDESVLVGARERQRGERDRGDDSSAPCG